MVECRSTSSITLLTVRHCTELFCRKIPEQGNRAEVVLRVLHRYSTAHHLCSALHPPHRTALGGDEFLGQLTLPLQDFDVYEKPRAM